MKTRRLHKDEIRYTGFDYRFKGGSLRDITTMDMAYFSKRPYPQEAVNRSYKLRNSDDFIKFHASKKLCLHLSEWLPNPETVYSMLRMTTLLGKNAVEEKESE